MIRKSDIGKNAIKADKHIIDLSIITEKLANLCVTSEKISDLAVITEKINNLAVITAKLADLAVTDIKISDLAVITEKINDLAVTTAKLADLAITNAKIDNATITARKLEADCIRIAEEFLLIAGVQEVAADAEATLVFPHSANKLKGATIDNVKSAFAILDYEWAASAQGTLQVYDDVVNFVLAETDNLTNGDTNNNLILSVEPNDLHFNSKLVCRAHITTAGAANEVIKIHRCFLKIFRGYS